MPERIKCTYGSCKMWFDSEKAMKRHKEQSDEHDYCKKCDQDFDDWDEWAQHKAFRPDTHDKACRICGQEFKTTSGLKRHIDLSHRVDQKLPCLGCGEEFRSASLYIEHVEFGHCKVISNLDFIGHIVHKRLVADLLKGDETYQAFMHKISKFNASQDCEDEGGIKLTGENVLDVEDEGQTKHVGYAAIMPEVTEDEAAEIANSDPFPPLSSPWATNLTSGMSRMSISGKSESTVKNGSVSHRSSHAWTGRSSKTLFPNAMPAPVPTEFSISYHEEQVESQHGINIMNTRFWDPLCKTDYKPERFFNGVTETYSCPFVCEQHFSSPAHLATHILEKHRVVKCQCPRCFRSYHSMTGLVAHLQALGGKCEANKADDFNIYLDNITGGFLSVKDKVRGDHEYAPTIPFIDKHSGVIDMYTPYQAHYQQYEATRPADYKEPPKVTQLGHSWMH